MIVFRSDLCFLKEQSLGGKGRILQIKQALHSTSSLLLGGPFSLPFRVDYMVGWVKCFDVGIFVLCNPKTHRSMTALLGGPIEQYSKNHIEQGILR